MTDNRTINRAATAQAGAQGSLVIFDQSMLRRAA